MRKRGLLAFITFLLVFLSGVVVGSDFVKGFIVSIKGDTTYGYIELRGSSEIKSAIRFKKIDGKLIKEYTPNDLSLFAFESGEVFRSVIYDKKDEGKTIKIKYFAQWLLNADYNLYKMQLSFLANDFVYVIQKDNDYHTIRRRLNSQGRRTDELSRQSIGLLIYLLNSCPEETDTIKNMKFTDEQMIGLLTKHSKCAIPLLETKEHTHSSKVKFGIMADAGVRMIGISNEEFFNKDFLFGADVGLYCNISYPSVSRIVSTTMGLSASYYTEGDEYLWLFRLPLLCNINIYKGKNQSFDFLAGVTFLILRSSINNGFDTNLSLGFSYEIYRIRFSLGYEKNLIGLLAQNIHYASLNVGYRF